MMNARYASRSQPRLTYTEAVIEGIRQEMRADSSVFYLGQDVGIFGGSMQGTQGLLAEFGPERIIETPISESSTTGIGVGAALFGRKPIVEISFGEFLPAAMNQLINQAPNIFYMTGGTLKVPLVIRTRVGDGPYGGHPQDYSAWFGHAPGMKVVMPATPPDAMQLMKAAIQDSNPVLFLEPMSLSHGRREEVDVEAGGAELGKARIARGGQDITVVAYGSELPLALRAAEKAARESIDVEVIDLRTLVPWDVATVIGSVKKTQRLVTVHEAWKYHGHGAEVVARVSEMLGAGIHLRVARVGAKPVPIPSGPLRKWALPSVDEIYSAIMDCVALGETSGG